jgi:hypothetical protein
MEFDKPRIAADINKHDEDFFHIHDIIPFKNAMKNHDMASY